MKLLLDTCAIIHLLNNDERLGEMARAAILDTANIIHVSVISLFEMAVKIRIGKLAMNLSDALILIEETTIQRLEVEDSHLIAMAKITSADDHHDPFDLMLIAQAVAEGMTIVTSDQKFGLYPINVLPA